MLLTDNSGWVANALGGTLTKLNRESEQLGVFPVGEEPNAMVFDGEFNWTTNRNEASVNKVGLGGTLLGAFKRARFPRLSCSTAKRSGSRQT